MNELLVASVVLLWAVVIAMAFIVYALARQIGVLHERVAPAGAMMPGRGPRVGETVPVLAVITLDGSSRPIGAPQSRDLLVLFVSPTCPVCRTLVPTARSVALAEQLDLLLASDGDDQGRHLEYARALNVDRSAYVLSEPLGRTYEVGKLPFAVLIDRNGVLRAKGLVNTREHLESLLEARDLGVASIQEFIDGAKHAQSK